MSLKKTLTTFFEKKSTNTLKNQKSSETVQKPLNLNTFLRKFRKYLFSMQIVFIDYVLMSISLKIKVYIKE